MKSATTAYERACGRFSSGKIAMFGEAVMGFLRTSLKGLPQWTRGSRPRGVVGIAALLCC